MGYQMLQLYYEYGTVMLVILQASTVDSVEVLSPGLKPATLLYHPARKPPECPERPRNRTIAYDTILCIMMRIHMDTHTFMMFYVSHLLHIVHIRGCAWVTATLHTSWLRAPLRSASSEASLQKIICIHHVYVYVYAYV